MADAGATPAGRSWSVAGLVLAGLGLAMFPLGGLVGIVCGGIARSKGDQTLGLVAIVASTPTAQPPCHSRATSPPGAVAGAVVGFADPVSNG